MMQSFLPKKFSKILLATVTSAVISGNALATHVNGAITISNQTQCNIVLDQSTESSNGVIELSNQTVKPKKTSSKIIFQLDTGVYGSGDVFANASCKAEGSGSAKYWTLLLAGKASGSFITEADCKATISGTVEGGQGILPGTFANLDAHGIDKNTGKSSSELNIFVSRKSASGIVISSSLSNMEFCGEGNGFYRVKAPKVKPLAVKGVGEEITKGYFDNHTVIVEDASKDADYVGEIARQVVRFTEFHKLYRTRVENPYAEKVIFNEDGTFTLLARGTYWGNRVQEFGPSNHYVTVTIEKFSQLPHLNICVDNGRLRVFPSVEYPDVQSCE